MNYKYNLKIHVGYPKTGTTTLQKHFFPKIQEVQYLGKYSNDTKLFNFDTQIIKDLIFKSKEEINFKSNLKRLKKHLIHNNILLSEESFLSNSLRTTRFDKEDVLPVQNNISYNIREFFNNEEFEVKVLFTIRRQDEMITSQYAQSYVHYYSRYKKTDTFQKFLNIYLDDENTGNTYVETLDYYKIITQYEAIFGKENITVLVFEELQENPKEFYEKLCRYLEIDENKYSQVAIKKNENKRSTERKYKKTRDISVYEKLFFIKNKYLPFIKLSLSKNIKERLKNIIWTSNKKISETIFLTNDQKRLLLEKYNDSNKKLSEEYNLNLKKYGYYND